MDKLQVQNIYSGVMAQLRDYNYVLMVHGSDLMVAK